MPTVTFRIRKTVVWTLIVLSVSTWTTRPVLRAEQPTETEETPWIPGTEGEVLPGEVARPAQLPGIGRWQMIRVTPRCYVYSVTWSPDGKLFAHTDGQYVRVSEPGTLKIQHVLVGHTGFVRAVAWSPDGEIIASAGTDGTIRLWQIDGSPKDVIEGYPEEINSIC